MAEPESQYGGGQDNDPLQPKHSPADTAAGAQLNLDSCELCKPGAASIYALGETS